MFTLSYDKALKIQQYQLVFHRKTLGMKGIKYIKSITKECPVNLNPFKEVNVVIINELIPRGGDIEKVIGLRKSKASDDCLMWANAYKNNMIYSS